VSNGSEIPEGDTYDQLPLYLVLPQNSVERGGLKFGTDDAEKANHAAHQFACEVNGVFVAIYQRVGMVRKRT
jgi:hypothetical protein